MKPHWVVGFFLASYVYGALPDSTLTPGASGTLTQAELCSPSFRTANIRHVSGTEKHKVYQEYGMIAGQKPCPCEVDHLIPLEIGGSNDITNLWPESYNGTCNAHDKDDLENKMRELVCTGKLPLQQARQEISTNWVTAYQKYVGGPNCHETPFTVIGQ